MRNGFLAPVSVIVVTLERAAMLERTLEQLAVQRTLPTECIVVDQSDSPPACHALNRLRSRGVTCRVIRSGHRSISGARNVGLQHASCPIVLYLDDDVDLESDVVGEHARYYYHDPGLAAVAGHVTCRPLGPEYEAANTFRPLGDEVPFGRGCHMSFQATWLRQIGGFNTFITNQGDEMYAFDRIRQAGGRIRNGSRAVVRHLVAFRGGNRLLDARSSDDLLRIFRDGMVRSISSKPPLHWFLWPIKHIGLLWTAVRKERSRTTGLRKVLSTCCEGIRLGRRSRQTADHLALSLELAGLIDSNPNFSSAA